MFECLYCGNVFEKLTDIGACPACGGPKPKHLKPEVQTVVVGRYTYVPQSNYVPGHYRPPEPTFRQRTYETLGFKVLGWVTGISMVTFIAIFLYFWFFYTTGAPKDSDPSYRNYIPTAVASPTTYVRNDPWSETSWLTSAEVMDLRTQEQVIHLAYLNRGEAKYTNQSVIFDSNGWLRSTPRGVSQLATTDTRVTITVNGSEYHLNVLQPFVIANQPETIFIVDLSGQIWSIKLTNVNLVDLSAAQNSLPVIITPNGDLSLSY